METVKILKRNIHQNSVAILKLTSVIEQLNQNVSPLMSYINLQLSMMEQNSSTTHNLSSNNTVSHAMDTSSEASMNVSTNPVLREYNCYNELKKTEEVIEISKKKLTTIWQKNLNK